MLVGHLAPVGPIAAAVERHWQPEWPRWTRALPWAALAGSVFWWLAHTAGVRRRGRLKARRKPLAYLAALPRHEGSWLLHLDGSRWVTRTSAPPRG